MINIVTIEREYGCGSSEISRLLANRAGWKLWDQSLTKEIAQLSNFSEAVVQEQGGTKRSVVQPALQILPSRKL
jgi:Cytidylate kinase-like family